MPSGTLPPIRPLPNPNGYDALVKAGEMAAIETGDFDETKLEDLRAQTAKNSGALQAARIGLQEDCAVPLQFSLNVRASTFRNWPTSKGWPRRLWLKASWRKWKTARAMR